MNRMFRYFHFVTTGMLAALMITASLTGCDRSRADSVHSGKKVVVLGFDGVDPILLSKYMAEGMLPNFKRLSTEGYYEPLGTSVPPQSPVAWSNFITGMNPGGHGIYDFLHRDPDLMIPISSTSKTEGSSNTIKMGKWIIPLASGHVKNLRKGKAFWNVLDDHNIPTIVFKVPANFPPVESKGKTVSGMGTPDLLGTFGTFSFYTDDPPPNRDVISGGVVYPIQMINNGFEANLAGPANAFVEHQPSALIPFKVFRDPEYPTAQVEIQGHKILLKEKEWSEWVNVKFDMLPMGLQSVSGICRFYLKEVRPKMRLYVTPVNIDPADPALPLSTPEDYVKELYNDCGNFYTQGMPEDTKALSWGVFDHADFRSQTELVMKERIRLFDQVFKDYNDGLFFFYFSSTDLDAHMFYNMIDPSHPSYDPELAKKFGDVIPSVYRDVDSVVGKVLDKIDDSTTLIVMSDHGFAPFKRAVNLNSWLLQQGYVKLKPGAKQEDVQYYDKVDWSRTRAYGLGFNGLYVNLRSRERSGIVLPSEKKKLLSEISEKLLQLRDPENGQKVVDRVYLAEDVYSGANLAYAPDLVVGYSRGYRASWETTIGSFPKGWLTNNMDPWSGDHCMAAELVPGVILTNKKIRAEHPKLYDLAPTILAEFGVDKDDDMVGHSIF